MKKKKINKISKKIFEQLSESYSLTRKRRTNTIEMEEPVKSEEEYICEYDEEISTKFKKLFNNIIKYPDNIRISYTSSYINIEISDIKYIKKSRPQSTNSNIKMSSGEEQLSIYIFKDKSFTLTQ